MDKHLRCASLHLLCGGEGVNELEHCAAAQAALPEALGYPLCQDQRRKGPVSCRAACLTFEDQRSQHTSGWSDSGRVLQRRRKPQS